MYPALLWVLIHWKICRHPNDSRKFIPWWGHQLKTFSSLLATCVGNSSVTGEFPSQAQCHRALIFSLSCAWTNGLVNNWDIGDFRRHHAHYDVAVMHDFCHRYQKVAIGNVSRPISQIPQRIKQMSHNAPFCNRTVHTCAHFCYKVEHCGIWDCCIVGFVQQVSSIWSSANTRTLRV